MSDTIPLARYLFTRLRQLGVETIHGVPGDFNLTLLDHVEPSGLRWVGNCNELNAGYAADGYARVKGLGALITTFGVGELSAVNAIAGAYSELARVVHIVGTPARHLQESRSLQHHTLVDGNYDHFARMYEPITVGQACLSDPRTSAQLIDTTIQQCLLQSRPVYIRIPVDMVPVEVPASGLDSPLTIPQLFSRPNAEAAIAATLMRLKPCRRPMILVDGESDAYGIVEEVHRIVKDTRWPTWTSAFGKGLVDEDLPNVMGVWSGRYGNEMEQAYVESADLILCFGPHFSGTNTYAFSTVPNAKTSILVRSSSVHIDSQVFRDLPAKRFLSLLSAALNDFGMSLVAGLVPSSAPVSSMTPAPTPAPRDKLSQALFYHFLGAWLHSGDILLAETGTAGVGCRDMKLPTGVRLFNPSTWLSIGYMLPAAQGAAVAQREQASSKAGPGLTEGRPPRTILLIGDGSFQMTAQELSTIIREKLNVLLLLINNDGYTIERCIHGVKAQYNDVAPWRYLNAPSFFGAPESSVDGGYDAMTSRVTTWEELRVALDSSSCLRKPSLHMVEVMMDREDAPAFLDDMLKTQLATT